MAKSNPVIAAYNQGKEDGKREAKLDALTFVEAAYMDPKVERGTPLAEGILELATRLSEIMK